MKWSRSEDFASYLAISGKNAKFEFLISDFDPRPPEKVTYQKQKNATCKLADGVLTILTTKTSIALRIIRLNDVYHKRKYNDI